MWAAAADPHGPVSCGRRGPWDRVPTRDGDGTRPPQRRVRGPSPQPVLRGSPCPALAVATLPTREGGSRGRTLCLQRRARGSRSARVPPDRGRPGQPGTERATPATPWGSLSASWLRGTPGRRRASTEGVVIRVGPRGRLPVTCGRLRFSQKLRRGFCRAGPVPLTPRLCPGRQSVRVRTDDPGTLAPCLKLNCARLLPNIIF